MICEIPNIIRPDNRARPKYRREISPKNGVAKFNIFDNTQVNQGFQWNNLNNVSYMKEPGNPDIDALKSVRSRVVSFTNSLGMHGESAVLAHAVPFDTTIVDINDLGDLIDNGVQGLFTSEGGAFFTTLSNIPLYTVIADCTQTIFYGEDRQSNRVGGLIHSGRSETDDMLPYHAVKHAIEKYNLDPKTIKLGISPSLEPKYHYIQEEDIDISVVNMGDWEAYIIHVNGLYYLDVRSYVADQYIEAGVPAKNIELNLRGTYEPSIENTVFSYRRSKVDSLPMSCLGIAVELK